MPRKQISFASDIFDKMSGGLSSFSDFDALMRSAPGDPKDDDAIDDVRDAVVRSLTKLSDREQTVIRLTVYDGLSLRRVGEIMGFSDVHIMRIRNVACDKMKNELTMSVEIRRRYPMAKTWDASATQWVFHISQMSGDKDNQRVDLGLIHDRIDALIGTVVHNKTEPSPDMYIAVAAPVVSHLRSVSNWDSGDMVRLLAAKQHDYGHGNINKFGQLGIVVRLSDKYERLTNLAFTQDFLASGNTVAPRVEESIIDTLRDLVGYCVVGLMLLDGTFNLELGEEYALSPDNNRV